MEPGLSGYGFLVALILRHETGSKLSAGHLCKSLQRCKRGTSVPEQDCTGVRLDAAQGGLDNTRPSLTASRPDAHAPVAKLDKAPAYEAGDCRFESCLARQSLSFASLTCGVSAKGENVPVVVRFAHLRSFRQGRKRPNQGFAARCGVAMWTLDCAHGKSELASVPSAGTGAGRDGYGVSVPCTAGSGNDCHESPAATCAGGSNNIAAGHPERTAYRRRACCCSRGCASVPCYAAKVFVVLFRTD